ncbi:DUF418 domain-containing protein [Sphingobium yanoikuyae]|uniref:DUF418 domain-containing protein n=1 Tax=Sphingobium yanoikuyae TaxID=13690 RepID=A0A9X7U4I0_SPHYA|nr:DUF418 domain-containing protein [Sphingobium yanoikuyae]QNG43536.1 DUF418 domain-containing protein [Sphingobium yanoikuyae]
MNGHEIAPTQAGRRIDTLDLLRGFAICGILLMNIPVMGGIGFSQGLPWPMLWNADWIALVLQLLFFEGTMRGLFTVLFGAAMFLMLRAPSSMGTDGMGLDGADPEAGRFDVWARRCLALMLLGVVQWAAFLWPGEILWNYGLCGLLLLGFRTLRPRALMVWAGVFLAGLSLMTAVTRYEQADLQRTSLVAQEAKAAGHALSEEQNEAIKQVATMRAQIHPDAAAVKAEVAQRTSLPGVLFWSLNMWAEFNLSAKGWETVAESLGFMLLGMALLRTGILSGEAQPRLYWRLVVIGYPLGLGLRAVGLAYSARMGFNIAPELVIPLASALKGGCYEVARLAVMFGHLGLIVGLYQRGMLGRAWPVRAMGRMALSIYSLQSILTSLLFYGFGQIGHFGFAGLMGIAVAIWLVTCAFAVWWLSFSAMGPAEYVLRRLAYGAGLAHGRQLTGRGTEPVHAA